MTEENTRKKEKFTLPKLAKALIFIGFSLMYTVTGFMSFFYGSGNEEGLFIGTTVILFLLVVAEFAVTVKANMSPVVLMLSILPFVFLSLAAGFISLDMYFFELHGFSLYILAARALIATVDCIREKKKALALLMPVVCAAIVILHPFNTEVIDIYSKIILELKGGQADRTGERGSWGAINYFFPERDNWEKIVEDSDFTLELVAEGNDENGNKYFNYEQGSFPTLDGSTVCVPLAVEFFRQHHDSDIERAKNYTRFSTTHYAYENLIYGNESGEGYDYDFQTHISYNYKYDAVDLILATEPSDEELEQAKQAGITLVKEPICWDAFVFITHKDNPVESLTVEQIRNIYSGKITNWKEVGGKDEKIRAFQREANSGSQTAMENLVMGGTDMIDPIEVKVIEGMGELVDAVAEYENETASLGYTYRYYIDNLYKNNSIKTISVDGISPTDDNIRSEAYPFTTNYYGVYAKERPTGKAFLDWILSEEGQACVKQAGYIAINE